MGVNCSTENACCTSDNTELNMESQFYQRSQASSTKTQTEHHTKAQRYSSFADMQVGDEHQLTRIESLLQDQTNLEEITKELSQKHGFATSLQLMKKFDKSYESYEMLLIQDRELQFESIDVGCLTYLGQVRSVSSDAEMSGLKVRCGFGVMQWPDGTTMEGYWYDDQSIGFGVFKTVKREAYEGVWQSDQATGMDVFKSTQQVNLWQQCASEQPASSEFTTSESNESVEVWSDGSFYHGMFVQGIKQGFGTYHWSDGSRYEGTWYNDEMSGRGSFTWADGRSFQGEFKNGVMHGTGVYTWKDGRKYEGQYLNNKKHGMGTYTYSDGSQYLGFWVDGLQHGNGQIVEAGTNFGRKGVWTQGKLTQWAK